MRGQKASDGETRISPNGYSYTKVDGKWRLTHHIKMEEILGRALAEDERVHFNSGDRFDFSPENLSVVKKGKANIRRRLAQLEARRDELDGQIAALRSELADEVHTEV